MSKAPARAGAGEGARHVSAEQRLDRGLVAGVLGEQVHGHEAPLRAHQIVVVRQRGLAAARPAQQVGAVDTVLGVAADARRQCLQLRAEAEEVGLRGVVDLGIGRHADDVVLGYRHQARRKLAGRAGDIIGDHQPGAGEPAGLRTPVEPAAQRGEMGGTDRNDQRRALALRACGEDAVGQVIEGAVREEEREHEGGAADIVAAELVVPRQLALGVVRDGRREGVPVGGIDGAVLVDGEQVGVRHRRRLAGRAILS